MSYNPSPRPSGPAKKAKRVSDVNALAGPQIQASLSPNLNYQGVNNMQQSPGNYYTPNSSPLNYGGQQFQPEFQNNFQYATTTSNEDRQNQFNMPYPQQQQQQLQPGMGQPNFAMFQQPLVQGMALEYGQKLADHGKDLVNKELEKYVSVSKLKYYFAVDNRYVLNKLRLIFFPFAQRDWSLKFDQDQPVQPRYDINAPDLYIPTMGYITYIVLAGFMLGMQKRFSPEQLGIQASSALAYNIFELIVYTITLYVTNIQTNLRTLDLVAFSGYKYASIVAILCLSMLFSSGGYWIGLLYCGATLAFFLLRTLKEKVLSEPIQTAAAPPHFDPYNQSKQFDHTLGRKRKLYFLFMFAILQFLLPFILTKHLINQVENQV